jgi:hypothetical protein
MMWYKVKAPVVCLHGLRNPILVFYALPFYATEGLQNMLLAIWKLTELERLYLDLGQAFHPVPELWYPNRHLHIRPC